jgi:hypothetical protein
VRVGSTENDGEGEMDGEMLQVLLPDGSDDGVCVAVSENVEVIDGVDVCEREWDTPTVKVGGECDSVHGREVLGVKDEDREPLNGRVTVNNNWVILFDNEEVCVCRALIVQLQLGLME